MITLSRYSEPEMLWDGIKQRNIVRDELKFETQQELLSNKLEINVNYDDHRMLGKDELRQRLLECYSTIALVDPLLKDTSVCLQDNAKLLITDSNGVIISCQSEDLVGYCCPAADKVNKNSQIKGLVELGNILDVTYDNGIHSQLVPIFNEYGEIQFYCGVGDKRPIMIEAFNILRSVVQLVQQRYKYLLMLEEYTDSFMDVVPHCLLIMDNKNRVVNANKLCLELLKVKDKKILRGMHISRLMSHYESISNSNEDYRDEFSLQVCGENIQCRIKNKQFVHTNIGDQLVVVFDELNNNKYISNISSADILPDISSAFNKIIGNNTEINKMKSLAKRAAKSSSTILIEGESGTGKELFAEAIHRESQRQGRFVPINCGAIPSELIQSELFGYEEGAFTGAKKKGSLGKFEIADGGTVFLDEVGEMPLNMQLTLLRFLQDKTITRVGGYSLKKLDVRIIAATNRDLKAEVEKGNFREDLYYRLNVINFEIPPLRKRKEDIPLIADYFLERLCNQECVPTLEINKQAMSALISYNWPGNARELENTIERAFIMREGKELNFDNMFLMSRNGAVNSRQEIVSSMEEVEREAIENHLRLCKNNISETANILGISRQTLYRKIKELNINRYDCGS